MKTYLKKISLLVLFFLTLSGCGESSIFPNIPLTTNPLVLANPIAMAASVANNRLYIVNSNNRVNYFDASFVIMDISNPVAPEAIAVISIANYSGQMILDEVRGYVYIPNRQSSSDEDNVDQVLRININEASPDFLQTDLVESGNNPFGAAFEDPFLFVAATRQAIQYNVDDIFGGYSLVDLDNFTTNLDEDPDTFGTRELALAPSGDNIFVTNQTGNMLILNRAEFLPPNGEPIFNLGEEPIDYVVEGSNSTQGAASDSQFVYVVEAAPDSLKVYTDAGLAPVVGDPLQISSASIQVANIPVGTDPSEVLVDEANARAYVTNTGSDDLSVIDLNLYQEIARISVDTTPDIDQEDENQEEQDQPFALTLIPGYLYVANFETNVIFIIDTNTLGVAGVFP